MEKQVEELKNLQNSGHITRLEKSSDEFYITPLVIAVKKDKSIKPAMDSKTINNAIQKKQISNAQHRLPHGEHCTDHHAIVRRRTRTIFNNRLRYAYSQLPLDEDTAKQCNFNIIGGQATGTYRLITDFYGLTDMPTEFQKAIDKTLYNLTNIFGFLDNIIIVTGGGKENHKKHLFNCLDRLNNENLAININKCHFAKDKIMWLGYEIREKGLKPIVSKTGNIKPKATHDAQTT